MANRLEISVEVIAHATENVEKILGSLGEFFNIKKEDFSRQELTGHFENPITLISTTIVKKEAKKFIENLVSKNPGLADKIIDGIEDRIQDSTLHLRFSKQDLMRGQSTLQQKDAVKLKINTPVYNKKETVKKYVELFKDSN